MMESRLANISNAWVRLSASKLSLTRPGYCVCFAIASAESRSPNQGEYASALHFGVKVTHIKSYFNKEQVSLLGGRSA